MKEQMLHLLEKNAFLTNAQLAAMLDKEEAQVAALRSELERQGILCGYHTLINWDRLQNGYLEAFIELKVVPKPERGFEEIAQTIASFEEVESVFLMSGGYDLFVTVAGKSFHQVAMFVAKRLSPLESVQSTATHFVLKRYKKEGVSFAEQESDERDGETLC